MKALSSRRGAKWPQTIHSEARKRAPVGQRLKKGRCRRLKRRSQQMQVKLTNYQGKLRRKKFEAPVKCSNFWVPMLRLQHLGINPSGWGIPDVISSHGGGARHPKPFVLSTSVGDQKWVGCAGVFERKSGESEWLWSHFKCDVICLKAFTWADASLQVCKAWARKKQDSNEFFPVKDLQTANLQIKQKKRRENVAAWESDEMMEIAPSRAPTSNWPRKICAQKW